MAQPSVRKKPAAYVACAVRVSPSLPYFPASMRYELPLTPISLKPTTFSDTERSDTGSEDDTDLRRDSGWKSLPTSQPSAKAATVETPTSCFGHFDRLNIEYTPKPKKKARVVVHHDGPVAAWSNASALRDVGMSSRDSAEQYALGETETSVKDGEVPLSEPRAQATREPLPEDDFNTDDEGGEYPAPWDILTSLRISSDAERQPEAEDPYFAARLAATCVILLRDELEEAARALGQWSIDLVGRRLWYRIVEDYITTPRGDNENGA